MIVGSNPVAALVGVVTVVTKTVDDPGPRETVAVTTTPGVSGEGGTRSVEASPMVVGDGPGPTSVGVKTVVTMTVEEPGPRDTVAVRTTPEESSAGPVGMAEPPVAVGVKPVAASGGVVTVVTMTVEEPGPRDSVAVTTTTEESVPTPGLEGLGDTVGPVVADGDRPVAVFGGWAMVVTMTVDELGPSETVIVSTTSTVSSPREVAGWGPVHSVGNVIGPVKVE